MADIDLVIKIPEELIEALNNAKKENAFDYMQVYNDTIYYAIKHSTPLPKGEWRRMSCLLEDEDDRYQCSRCGNVVHYRNMIDLYTFNGWCGRCGSNNYPGIVDYEDKEEK